MEYRLIIPYTLPSLNEYIKAERTHRNKGAEMKSTEQTAVKLLCNQQLRGVKIDKPVFVGRA